MQKLERLPTYPDGTAEESVQELIDKIEPPRLVRDKPKLHFLMDVLSSPEFNPDTASQISANALQPMSGVSLGTVYRYFGNNRGTARALIEYAADTVVGTLRNIDFDFPTAMSAPEKLQVGTVYGALVYAANPLYRSAVQTTIAAPQEMLHEHAAYTALTQRANLLFKAAVDTPDELRPQQYAEAQLNAIQVVGEGAVGEQASIDLAHRLFTDPITLSLLCR